jgi:hypothetical protein
MSFLNLAEHVYLEQNETLSTLKNMIWRMNYCQKQTQFPQGNNVLQTPASDRDDSILKDTCVF